MNKNRAFTLIELLVVIAIIAILAAILFPVFAQAKLSAKKAASLSNIKQITLSNIMYEGDYDDNFVLFSQNPFNTRCGDPGIANGSSRCKVAPYNTTYNWPLLLQPYIKSLGLYVDPGTGDPQGYMSDNENYRKDWNTQYGYNYLFLSPIGLSGLSGGGWLPNAGYSLFGIARSSTTAISPANTVMMTTAQGSIENFSTATIVPGLEYQTPDRNSLIDPGLGCQLYWATNRLEFVPTGSSVPNWGSSWVTNTPSIPGAGPLTGTTRALNPYQGANVGWVDGHAKTTTAGALAAGTDFGTSSTTSGYSGFGSVITDITKYLWTLDGTTKDGGTGPSGTPCQPIG